MPTKTQRRLARAPSQAFTDWDDVPLACTVIEAGRVLHVSRETVYGLIRRGHLRSTKVAGRRIITKAALREYLHDGAAEAG
jgi:excisionase family DNA binding protein